MKVGCRMPGMGPADDRTQLVRYLQGRGDRPDAVDETYAWALRRMVEIEGRRAILELVDRYGDALLADPPAPGSAAVTRVRGLEGDVSELGGLVTFLAPLESVGRMPDDAGPALREALDAPAISDAEAWLLPRCLSWVEQEHDKFEDAMCLCGLIAAAWLGLDGRETRLTARGRLEVARTIDAHRTTVESPWSDRESQVLLAGVAAKALSWGRDCLLELIGRCTDPPELEVGLVVASHVDLEISETMKDSLRSRGPRVRLAVQLLERRARTTEAFAEALLDALAGPDDHLPLGWVGLHLEDLAVELPREAARAASLIKRASGWPRTEAESEALRTLAGAEG